MLPNADYWIKALGLSRHIEGGSFRETYRSPLHLSREKLPGHFKGDCAISTSIYFLLEKEQFSAFHRIASDEVWHFYAGHTLLIFEIESGGELTTHRLGNDPESGASFQCVIKAGNWFASSVAKGGEYALAGCTVAPGFEFRDFELADRAALTALYPQHQSLIASHTYR